MNDLTGKDKAILEALIAIGFSQAEGLEEDDSAFNEYFEPEEEHLFYISRYGDWIVAECVFEHYICASINESLFLKESVSLDKSQQADIDEVVELIRQTAVNYEASQLQFPLLDLENNAIAPCYTELNC